MNLLFRLSGRSGVAGQVDGCTRNDRRVACVSLRALSDHTGSAGAGALPAVRSTSSAPEWPAVGRGVTLDPGIGHFSMTESCLVPGSGELRGRGMSFLCGWSIEVHDAWRPRWGLTSFHQCLYLSIIPDAGG